MKRRTPPEAHDHEQVGKALDYVADCVRVREDWAKVKLESNQAWLMIDVWVTDHPMIPPTMTEPFRAAIWLNTGLAYECEKDGAVGEDPIELKTWKPRRPT